MTSRALTDGEKWLCRTVFKQSLAIHNIEVVKRSVISGGFTPYGRINLDQYHYFEDFIGEKLSAPREQKIGESKSVKLARVHHFLHELGHCWQHFVGMAMLHEFRQAQSDARKERRAQGLNRSSMSKVDWRKAKHHSVYGYDISDGTDLMDFSMEEQCEIIADYFAWDLWGYKNTKSKAGGATYPTQSQLRSVLQQFLIDPNYPRYNSRIYDARATVREVWR